MGHPLVQSIALPLLVALAIMAVGRLLPGRLGHVVTGLAPGLGLLAAYGAILGWPDFPPRGAQQKLAWLILGALALGSVVTLVADSRRRIVTILATALAAPWIAWPLVNAGGGDLVLAIVSIVLAMGMACWCGHARADALTRGAPAAMAALALAIVAVLGNAASVGQIALALAVAGAGVSAWAWITAPRAYPAGWAVAQYGLLGVLIAQAACFVTRISLPALVALLLVPLAPVVVRRLRPGLTGASPWFGVALGVASALLAAPAVVIAIAMSGGMAY